MKVSLSELPNVPNISRPFVRFEKYDTLDRMMQRTVENFNKGKLKLPSWGKKGVDCRMNPDTFEIEALIDGKWHDIVALADHYMGN